MLEWLWSCQQENETMNPDQNEIMVENSQRDFSLSGQTTRMQSEINRLEGYLRKHGINILEEVEERKSGRERDPSKGNEKPRKGGFSL